MSADTALMNFSVSNQGKCQI